MTEVGAMNIFFLMEKEGGGGVELVTSPLDSGDILDGERATSFLFSCAHLKGVAGIFWKGRGGGGGEVCSHSASRARGGRAHLTTGLQYVDEMLRCSCSYSLRPISRSAPSCQT